MTEQEAYDIGKRAGQAAKHGDWALVRHFKRMVPSDPEHADLHRAYDEGYKAANHGRAR
ncbi:MAG TPA: hypothetical protein VG276_28030 [Actinomycetes bacterium]|jgi:hypothetical protein|nr:hypothetical protein [Actinomycetes bacterium]